MKRFLNGMRAGLTGRRADRRVALVMQLDNMAVLSRCIGVSATISLIAGIAARIGAEVADESPRISGSRGQFSVMLHCRGRASAMRLALRVQAQCQAGIDLPNHAPAPLLSAVLVTPEGGDDAIPDSDLFDAARRHLASADRLPGQMMLIAAQRQPGQPQMAAGPLPAPAANRPHAAHAMADRETAAVDMSRIRAVFQPQLSCHTGAVTGFETLARLDHPVRGLLSPADFLPLLSMADQRRLTTVILSLALAAIRHWDAEGHDVPTVSINVGAADLLVPDFADVILWELDRKEIAPSRLVIEVMEDLSPLDMQGVVGRNVERLSAAGCRIDLDDFGTGYASIEALRRLRVGRVKIDRSFVAGCDVDEAQQRMILAILALAERLGVDTLAEGVETAGEHAFVAQMGCSHVQGYAIARPMPLAETAAFLDQCRAQTERLPVLRRSA